MLGQQANGPSRGLLSKAHSVTFSRAGITPCNGLAHHVRRLLTTLTDYVQMVQYIMVQCNTCATTNTLFVSNV